MSAHDVMSPVNKSRIYISLKKVSLLKSESADDATMFTCNVKVYLQSSGNNDI